MASLKIFYYDSEGILQLQRQMGLITINIFIDEKNNNSSCFFSLHHCN